MNVPEHIEDVQKTHLKEVRNFLAQSVSKLIEERVRDQSVPAVLNDFMVQAIESIIKLDNIIVDEEIFIHDLYDDVLIECFSNIAGYGAGSVLEQMLVCKRLNEFTSGEEFVQLYNERYKSIERRW